ncbi:MAG: hypothetical protein NTX53_19425 [candidate division WOR-3 bacterium]|nr:hypothetical protein [candidate division WOR-3 bacterium]
MSARVEEHRAGHGLLFAHLGLEPGGFDMLNGVLNLHKQFRVARTDLLSALVE